MRIVSHVFGCEQLQLKRNDGKALSSVDFAGSSVSSVTFTGNCYDASHVQLNVSYTASMTLSGLLDYSLPAQCALHGPVTVCFSGSSIIAIRESARNAGLKSSMLDYSLLIGLPTFYSTCSTFEVRTVPFC